MEPEIGKKIKFFREKALLTQDELATKAKVSRGNVGGWETGARNPTARTLRRLAKALEIAPEMLLGEEIAPAGIDSSAMADFAAWCDKNGYREDRYHDLALWLVRHLSPSSLSEAMSAMVASNESVAEISFVDQAESREAEADFEAEMECEAKREGGESPDKSHKAVG